MVDHPRDAFQNLQPAGERAQRQLMLATRRSARVVVVGLLRAFALEDVIEIASHLLRIEESESAPAPRAPTRFRYSRSRSLAFSMSLRLARPASPFA